MNTYAGSVRHVIKYISKGGPMDVTNLLRVGDEILQVDGNELVGLSHERAIDLVREASDHVKIIVSRDKKREESGGNRGNDVLSEISECCTCIHVYVFCKVWNINVHV